MSLKDLSDSLGTKKEQPKQQEQKPFDTHAQIKTIPAYKLMAIQFPDAFTDDINNHIDNVIIPSKVSHSSQLVGQINRNEKSEQYTFPLNDDVGKDFKTVVDRVATSLLRDKTVTVVTVLQRLLKHGLYIVMKVITILYMHMVVKPQLDYQ